jgi:ABC-type lipoprotein release transport system permease subunit
MMRAKSISLLGGMLLISLLAGFLPANRAARLDPVAAVREE